MDEREFGRETFDVKVDGLDDGLISRRNRDILDELVDEDDLGVAVVMQRKSTHTKCEDRAFQSRMDDIIDLPKIVFSLDLNFMNSIAKA